MIKRYIWFFVGVLIAGIMVYRHHVWNDLVYKDKNLDYYLKRYSYTASAYCDKWKDNCKNMKRAKKIAKFINNANDGFEIFFSELDSYRRQNGHFSNSFFEMSSLNEFINKNILETSGDNLEKADGKTDLKKEFVVGIKYKNSDLKRCVKFVIHSKSSQNDAYVQFLDANSENDEVCGYLLKYSEFLNQKITINPNKTIKGMFFKEPNSTFVKF